MSFLFHVCRWHCLVCAVVWEHYGCSNSQKANKLITQQTAAPWWCRAEPQLCVWIKNRWIWTSASGRMEEVAGRGNSVKLYCKIFPRSPRPNIWEKLLKMNPLRLCKLPWKERVVGQLHLQLTSSKRWRKIRLSQQVLWEANCSHKERGWQPT